jgi:hypothetical protein
MGDQNLNGCWDLNQRLAVAGLGKTIKVLNLKLTEGNVKQASAHQVTYTEENIIKER